MEYSGSIPLKSVSSQRDLRAAACHASWRHCKHFREAFFTQQAHISKHWPFSTFCCNLNFLLCVYAWRNALSNTDRAAFTLGVPNNSQSDARCNGNEGRWNHLLKTGVLLSMRSYLFMCGALVSAREVAQCEAGQSRVHYCELSWTNKW